MKDKVLDKIFTLRIDRDSYLELKNIAEKEGMNTTSFIRMLIYRELIKRKYITREYVTNRLRLRL